MQLRLMAEFQRLPRPKHVLSTADGFNTPMSDERDSLKTCIYEEVTRRSPTEITVLFGMRRLPICSLFL